ncbi:nuclear envelope integral membrane protein 2-like [Sinocyclocheilus anshuiensis]|uniref:Nuclear envelope integral membrane protein 2-like n=1 Tax=Sinocyclocheilus anshuiensis TaxID=1608454 RepID=A0A671KMJ4_9TELE|nr:PREDICTED: nuclear envelope integral membrane protein 2-like [Sinocyclocheilus anshuiensis]
MGKLAAFIPVLTLLCASWQRAEGNKGYSYADCTYVKGDSAHEYSGSQCFCYSPGTEIEWKDFWSTFKVNVTSDEDIFVVFPVETRNCHHPDDLLTVTNCFVERYWPPTIQREKSLDISLVDEDVCFMTKSPRSNTKYTLHVSNKRLNRMCFLLFVCGLVLFFGAGNICRSSLFFYTTGVTLGVVGIFVFLTLVLRNFVPTRGLFLVLLGAGSGLSYMGIQRVINEWDDIVTEHWMELLVYVLISGLVSFAVCYKHGPITNKHTLNFMTWGMQVVSMVLLYYGITIPPAYYVLIMLLLCWKILPLAWSLLMWICSLFYSFLGLFRRKKRPKLRLLTEEEYREQGEIHTRASLEVLQEHCNKSGFPAWDTVLRLRSPQKFAEFLRNGSHVTQEELQNHENQYGLGGEYYENMLFNSSSSDTQSHRGEAEDNSEDERDSNSPPTLNNVPSPAVYTVYTPAVCQYPPVTYTPQPEPMDPEDQDFF